MPSRALGRSLVVGFIFVIFLFVGENCSAASPALIRAEDRRFFPSAGPVVDCGTELRCVQRAIGSARLAFVFSYAPWCATSRKSARWLSEFAASDASVIVVGIDCWSAGECSYTVSNTKSARF